MGRKAVDTRGNVRVGTRRMFARILLVFVVIALVAIFLIGRVLRLNKTKGKEYERKVLAQRSYSSKEISYRRGDITDRNGNKLAISKKVYDLVLDPFLIRSDESYTEATAEALEKVFGLEKAQFDKILEEHGDSQYYVMKEYKKVAKSLVKKFKDMAKENSKIKGVTFDERFERYYPYKTVGSKIIGFCSDESEGVWGIEKQYNTDLSGTNGRQYGYYDSNLSLVETVREATNGNNIVSTIDVNVQGILERHMNEFQKKVGSKNMGCIIMNPQNGEIYAMSSYPEYDLNNPRDLSVLYSKSEIEKLSDKEKSDALNQLWRNFCISDAYEPGSTYKPVTVAAALDEGVTNEKKHYYCDGYQKVNGVQIKCVAYNAGGHKDQDICQALMNSCNDVLMQLGEKLGRLKFLEYNADFGFGKKTGIDLPGESVGGVFNTETMHAVELATSSFGQGQTVTMIQLAAAFCAVINGGNYYEPHVVKEIDSTSGVSLSTKDNMLVRRVITEGTSAKLRKYLYKTVEEGTANPAAVAGYSFGGKTGTAQKHPVALKNYLVSFIGFTPIDHPEVVVYVVVDEPHVADQAHSTYATEFSSEVMKEVLPLLGLYQSEDTDKKDITKATDIKLPSAEVPEGGISDIDFPVMTEEPAAEKEKGE